MVWAWDLWCGFSGTGNLYISPDNHKLRLCGSFDISGSGILFYHICRYLNGLLMVSTEFYYNWNRNNGLTALDYVIPLSANPRIYFETIE